MSEVAEIAKGLTEAQRRVILDKEWGWFQGLTLGRDPDNFTKGDRTALRNLVPKGVIEIAPSFHAIHRDVFKFTPLGLAVHTHLSSKGDGR